MVQRLTSELVQHKGVHASEYLNKAYRYVDSVDELRSMKRPAVDGDIVVVYSYYGRVAGRKGGGGKFYYDATDNTTVDDGGSCIVSSSGARFKRFYSEPKVYMEDFGVVASTGVDSSSQVDKCIAFAESLAVSGFSKRVEVVCARKLKTSKSLFLNPGKVFLGVPGGSVEWVFDSAGTYTDNYAMHITGNLAVLGQEGDTPYANTTIHAISHVMFALMSGGALATNVNFIKHYSTLAGASGRAEIVSQTGFFKVRTRGFKDVYTNGDNGWGLTFDQCGFDAFDRLAVLSSAVNNSERITFLECVAQNGRLGFDIYGWTGGLQFIGGSLDYLREGEIKNRGGFAVFDKVHIETDDRKQPVAISQFATASGITMFKNCTFVNVRNNLNTVNLFVTDRRNNIILEDNRFTFSEELVGSDLQTKNMRMTDSVGVDWRENWIFSGQTGRHLMFTQGIIRAAQPAYIKVSGYAGVTLTRSSGEVTIVPATPIVTTKFVEFQVPIRQLGHRFDSWMSVFRSCVLSASCSLTVYRTNEDMSIKEQIDQLTFGNGTGTLQPANDRADVSAGHTHYSFRFFLDPMSPGDSIVIAALGLLHWS